jgi:glycosyltransferase involved in cell wall biosynthesis
MKISVLIAARHDGPRISRSLASLNAQSHSEWELLVVEYGSADETRQQVQDFGSTTDRAVHYLNLGENHGAASARNRLLELATAEFIAFLDPGDEWTPTHLANAVNQLAEGADVVVSDVRITDPVSGRVLADITAPLQLSTNAARALFVRNPLTVPSSIAFRRTLAGRVGPFDLKFRALETRDFWFRCALRGARFVATHRPTCHSTQVTKPALSRVLLHADQTVQFYEKHREVSAIPAALRRRLLSASLVSQGRFLRESDPSRAAKCFWRAWSLQPVHVQTLGQFALMGCRPPSSSGSASIRDESPRPESSHIAHTPKSA